MIDPSRRRRRRRVHRARLLGACGAGFRRRRHPPGVGRRRRVPPFGPTSSTSCSRVCSPSTTSGAAHQAVQRHPRQLPLPALLRHPGRHRRHRARTRCPTAARCSSRLLASPTATSGGPGRGRRALPEPHGGVRARRGRREGHRLRVGLHRARGLPRPPRRLRAVHHRWPGGRAAAGAPRRASTPDRRHAAPTSSCTATSPRCPATR